MSKKSVAVSGAQLVSLGSPVQLEALNAQAAPESGGTQPKEGSKRVLTPARSPKAEPITQPALVLNGSVSAARLGHPMKKRKFPDGAPRSGTQSTRLLPASIEKACCPSKNQIAAPLTGVAASARPMTVDVAVVTLVTRSCPPAAPTILIFMPATSGGFG